jgi:phospholipid/cholesterol/gamma-HCH transport system permease protein
MELLARLGHFGTFAGRVAIRSVSPPLNWGDLWRHTFVTTMRCLGPVLAVTFPFGMVIGLQGLVIFDLFGAQRLLPSLISVAVLRELSPVLVSVLVAAQAGSSYAAELGAMRIKEEIDATEVMAVDPLRWHVVPRVLALAMAGPVLDLLGAAAGLFGGYVMSCWIKGEPGGVFLANLWQLTRPFDLVGGLLKTTCFGVLVGTIACYHGFYAKGGAAGVGQGVNDTVVRSVLAFFVANYLLTSAMFGL